MAASHVLDPPARTVGRVVALLVAGFLFVAGAVATVPLITERDTRGSLAALDGPGPFSVNQPVRTEMGVVTVTTVERLGGLTSQDMAGSTHNIQNLVPGEKAQVQVTLRLTDDTGRAVSWEAGQVMLRAGSAAPVVPLSSTLPSREVGAGTSVEGTLGYVAPRDGSRLLLQFPAVGGGVTAVDLGRTDSTPAIDDDHHP